MNCIKCGGDMIGDGYTSVLRCECADEAAYDYCEPDAGPVYCDFEEITQAKVDEAFEGVRAEWNKRLEASGHTEAMFIALDSTGFVAAFMYEYERARELTEDAGLVMPVLTEGLTLTAGDSGA